MTYETAVFLETPRLPAAGPTDRDRWALRILQFGGLAVVLAATTYKAFELDRFFLPKELTLHLTALGAGLLAARTFRRTPFTRVDLLLVLYLLLGLIGTIFATNVWAALRALTVSASGVAIFWAARAMRTAELDRPLLMALALAVVLGAVTSCLQAYGIRTDLFSINRAPGGTLGNRNFVAHMAAFGLPVVLLAALNARRASGFLIGALGATIVATTLVLTRSRAGWLASGAVLLVWLLAMVAAPPLRRDGRTWRRFTGILAGAALGVLAAVFLPNALRWRSENPYLESIRGVANFQEGSGRGRVVQYRRSLRMTLEHPLLGVGPGNWAVEYPKYAARRDPSMNRSQPGTTANPWPSSDWVASVSERGPIATILIILALAGIAWRGLLQLRAAQTPGDGLAAAALLGTLLAVAVAGMFDAVLLLALPTLLVWAILGALWLPPETSEFDASRTRSDALIAVAILAGLGAVRSASQLTAA
ncbi:MAG TPA: O-antigen ligase family protein, partial [Longimicrobiales bacterium]|nr:O-antigen ligase family protein [Longimicrobiales bacterium]